MRQNKDVIHIFVFHFSEKITKQLIFPTVFRTFVKILKENTHIPVLLFPGDYSQVTDKADGLLFLSLFSRHMYGCNMNIYIILLIVAMNVMGMKNLGGVSNGIK